MAILSLNGNYFEVTGGFSVMGDGDRGDTFDPYPVSETQALDRMQAWESEATESAETPSWR